jgi:hypothetical protein
MTLVGMAAWVGAGSLDADYAALVVDAEGAGAVRVLGKEGDLIVRVDLADCAGLLLREEDSAVFCAD